MREIQDAVCSLYKEREYSSDICLLALGVNEEAGEVAAAILDILPGFKQSGKRIPSSLEHEIVDLCIYLLALANSIGLDLEMSLRERLGILP